jgi:hypothetical protein
VVSDSDLYGFVVMSVAPEGYHAATPLNRFEHRRPLLERLQAFLQVVVPVVDALDAFQLVIHAALGDVRGNPQRGKL